MVPGVDGHSAGNRVPDAGAGSRVGRFHDDEGPLLQGHHPEVLRVVQRLEEGAVARPGVVAQTQVPVLPPANLEGSHTHTLDHQHLFESNKRQDGLEAEPRQPGLTMASLGSLLSPRFW